MKMTYHAQMERTDRLVYIAMTVGFGEVVFEHRTEVHRECNYLWHTLRVSLCHRR